MRKCGRRFEAQSCTLSGGEASLGTMCQVCSICGMLQVMLGIQILSGRANLILALPKPNSATLSDSRGPRMMQRLVRRSRSDRHHPQTVRKLLHCQQSQMSQISGTVSPHNLNSMARLYSRRTSTVTPTFKQPLSAPSVHLMKGLPNEQCAIV